MIAEAFNAVPPFLVTFPFFFFIPFYSYNRYPSRVFHWYIRQLQGINTDFLSEKTDRKEVIAEATRDVLSPPATTDMFARHVVPRQAALVRQHAARPLPLAALRTDILRRRNLSQLSQSSSKVSTIFGALLAFGIATTGYGLCVHLPFTPRG